MTEELSVKGMILSAAPYGEYGRRLVMLTDKLGKITVFASGAAKAGSKLIGAVRPFTAAEFSLARGGGAYNIHGARIIDSFEEIPLDPDTAMHGFYILELCVYFSEEGMEEKDARTLLNLSFMALSALRRAELSPELIVSTFKLRLLKLEGEYTEEPPLINDKAAADEVNTTASLWKYALSAPISRLFLTEAFGTGETADFQKNIEFLFKKQIPKDFKSIQMLRQL